MSGAGKARWWRIALVAAAAVSGVLAWRFLEPPELPEGFAKGNGRIEAVEIDVASKTAGRVREILADEGDFVQAGQVLANMDSAVLVAQRREAEAGLQRALIGIEVARSLVTQREAEKADPGPAAPPRGYRRGTVAPSSLGAPPPRSRRARKLRAAQLEDRRHGVASGVEA